MENAPLVSVIMPSYNHAQYIEKAIESVLAQSYKNIELIVIDDGSTDDTLSILNELNKQNKFTLVTQENRGVCKTLNRGVREFSSGEYVTLVASDDYWEESKIEKQVAALCNRREAEFSFTQATEFDSETGRALRVFPSSPLSGQVLNKVFLRQHVPAGSIMFTRRLFDKIGGFDKNLREEDWDFVIRCAAETEFAPVSEPLFNYRSHETNVMKTMGRRVIFHQKAMILSKNYMLVSPFVWFRAIAMHFLYDHLFTKSRLLTKLKRFF